MVPHLIDGRGSQAVRRLRETHRTPRPRQRTGHWRSTRRGLVAQQVVRSDILLEVDERKGLMESILRQVLGTLRVK